MGPCCKQWSNQVRCTGTPPSLRSHGWREGRRGLRSDLFVTWGIFSAFAIITAVEVLALPFRRRNGKDFTCQEQRLNRFSLKNRISCPARAYSQTLDGSEVVMPLQSPASTNNSKAGGVFVYCPVLEKLVSLAFNGCCGVKGGLAISMRGNELLKTVIVAYLLKR